MSLGPKKIPLDPVERRNRFLSQMKILLPVQLLLTVVMFLSLTLNPITSEHYQLALYLAMATGLVATFQLVVLAFVASGGKGIYDSYLFYYRILYISTTIFIIVSLGFFCWTLWELALAYERVNSLFSGYLALIPIFGVVYATGWMVWYWFVPTHPDDN
jgi:hypothetical protein